MWWTLLRAKMTFNQPIRDNLTRPLSMEWAAFVFGHRGLETWPCFSRFGGGDGST